MFNRGKFKNKMVFRNKLKNLLMFEAFDLEKFLEDPDGNMHDDSDDRIDVGTYVFSYRGPGQVVDESGNFWVVRLLSEDGKDVKVPKEECEKMTMSQVEEYRESISKIGIDQELESIKDELTSYLQTFVEEPTELQYIYTGNVEKGLSFFDDIIIEILRLKMKDPDLILRDNTWIVSQLISTGLNAIESSSDDEEVRERIKKMWEEIMNL